MFLLKQIRNPIFFFCTFFLAYSPLIKAQEFLWAEGDTEYNNDEYKGVATDAQGNCYVTGSKNFSMTLRKYNPEGLLLWSQQQSYQTRGHALSLDDSNNVYVTGYFVYEVTFGDSVDLVGAGEEDIFTAKFNASGELIWVTQAGGEAVTNENDRGNSIVADHKGNAYVAGSYEGPATFDSITVTGGGKMDIFLAKYNTDGSILWLRHAGNTEMDFASGLVLDEDGNCYVTGQFRNSISFDTIILTSNGSNADIFLAKYDSSGNVLWARNFGNTSTDAGTSLSTDNNGNIFMTGYGGAIDFDGTMLPNTGGTNVFTWKGDKDGNTIWAKSASSTSIDYGYAVCGDASGNCFITGRYGVLESGALSMTFDNITINSTGGDDVFIAKYDTDGNILWALTAGSTWRYDQGSAIATDESGNCFVGGLFWGGTGNYSGSFGSYTIDGTGNNDAFVCKIGNVFTGTGEAMNAPPQIMVFPNPLGSGQSPGIFLSDLQRTGEPLLFLLYDPFGRKIIEQPVISDPFTIESVNVLPGIYFYCVHSEAQIIGSGKVVIE